MRWRSVACLATAALLRRLARLWIVPATGLVDLAEALEARA